MGEGGGGWGRNEGGGGRGGREGHKEAGRDGGRGVRKREREREQRGGWRGREEQWEGGGGAGQLSGWRDGRAWAGSWVPWVEGVGKPRVGCGRRAQEASDWPARGMRLSFRSAGAKPLGRRGNASLSGSLERRVRRREGADEGKATIRSASVAEGGPGGFG